MIPREALPRGALAGVVNMFVDISHQQRAAERERLLVGELHHRTSNLFAVVHALASRSLTGDMTLDQARETFKARLSAMARTHNKLIEKSWAEVAVQEVVSLELEPLAGQVEARGPESLLPPAQVQNLSLALHELTTNATKHGALSVPEGKVLVTWSEEVWEEGQRVMKLRWEERGGPPVAVPTRHGFGASLLKRLYAGVHLDFSPGGLVCEFELALTKPSHAALADGARRSDS